MSHNRQLNDDPAAVYGALYTSGLLLVFDVFCMKTLHTSELLLSNSYLRPVISCVSFLSFFFYTFIVACMFFSFFLVFFCVFVCFVFAAAIVK